MRVGETKVHPGRCRGSLGSDLRACGHYTCPALTHGTHPKSAGGKAPLSLGLVPPRANQITSSSAPGLHKT